MEGLGLIPGTVKRFDASTGLRVPHIGWSGLSVRPGVPLLAGCERERLYFVHSFAAFGGASPAADAWTAATCDYGGPFVAAVAKGGVHAVQFHPEKSGSAGLGILNTFLSGKAGTASRPSPRSSPGSVSLPLARRVIACLDVRATDEGRLVCTKGAGYDVRDAADGGAVRNLGDPAEMAARYAAEGADEVTFLNITGYRDSPLDDAPMLQLLRSTSEAVFVPLTVGGGIRALTDGRGVSHTAVDVAAAYFRAGADKVSLGSDAVAAAEAYIAAGRVASGASSLEAISAKYGAQAVVVSIDPRRVFVAHASDTRHETLRSPRPGPHGETLCWYQCTVAGGREGRDISAQELAAAAEALGAGELLLNCIDEDGRGDGFDTQLIASVAARVSIPVIASSGAGSPQHFADVFGRTDASAALAAGIFHRNQVTIRQVKEAMVDANIPTRVEAPAAALV